LAAALDLLLPRACARCGGAPEPGSAFCARCDLAVPRLPRSGCFACQAPTPKRDTRCAACARRRSALAQVAAAAPFEGDVADWVHRFKYPARGFAGLDARPAAALAALIEEAAVRIGNASFDRLVPVPIHRERLRARGFHPAAELARALGRSRRVAVDTRLLAATRATASQTGLDRAARRRNVRDAFAVTRPIPRGTAIALVDDVVTTGATLEECARTLRRGGAGRVVAICAARTL
jgi:ComF family protein